MDVVVSISFRFGTSVDDAANAWVSMALGDEHPALSPKARHLGSAALSTSTTLEWVGRSLTAGGGTVTFEFGLSPARGPRDRRASVSSRDVTVVVEMIPR